MIYDRYYYSKLNNREKKAYKKIYAAMQNHESSVTINGFVETDIPKLMSAINLDNPHLFYVDFRYGFRSDLFSQTIILKYIYNQADTLILTEKVKKVCNKILSKVAGKTEFEKELSLHDILARNVLYDDVAKDNLLKFHARSNTILGGSVLQNSRLRRNCQNIQIQSAGRGYFYRPCNKSRPAEMPIG